MSSTGYVSRTFSTPNGRDRLTVSYKVDKKKNPPKNNSQMTIADLFDLTA